MLAPNPDAQLPVEAPRFHDVTIVRKRKIERACVEAVPPEEFGIARQAKSIRDAGYCFHEVARSESDLIEQGYDPAVIQRLPTFIADTNTEARSRDTVDESDKFSSGGLNKATRLIKITEHYVRMDYEGNGKARLYRVTTGGDAASEVLMRDGEPDVNEVDYYPFAAITPIIVTHRFFGRSVADLVMDIQRIKTALLRGLLDNTYLVNLPRPVVNEQFHTESTLDDLLVARLGAPIRVKGPPSEAVQWQTIPDISGSIYPALQYVDALREWRTGVTRQGQGVDPNALQNQVATIANQMFNAAQAKVKLIARIFAETGVKDLFSLLHAVIRKHGSKAQTVRLRNKWVQVDPRAWQMREDMTINVGLGDGTKQEKLMGIQLLIGAQEKAIAAGGVSKHNLGESAKELTKLLGYKDDQRFFAFDYQPDPTKPPDPNAQPIQPPPDPKVQQAQMDAQLEMQKMERQAQIETVQAQADIATNNKKIEADIALKDREFQHKAMLEERKFELERELKLLDAQIRGAEHQQTMQMKSADHAMKTEQESRKVEHETTARIADTLTKFDEKMTKSQAENIQNLLTVLTAEMRRPKRAKKQKDGTWQTEYVQ